MSAVTPFTLAIPDADLDGLRDRLRRTRWPEPATVAGWVAEHLDASDALRVRHMASQFHLTDLAERAAEYVCGPRVVGLHFIELRVFVIGGGIVGFTLVPHLMSQL